jgi:hypothetical protein
MASPLAGSLAKTVGKALAGVFLPATLYRSASPLADELPYDEPSNPAAPSEFKCRAIHESYSDFYTKQNLINASDRKVLILANSLSVKPQNGDRVKVDGEDLTLTIVSVKTDPAKAVWECQAST